MPSDQKLVDSPKVLDFREQPCPQCQTIISVYAGYPAWCDQCGWNLQVESPWWVSESLFDKLLRVISQKSSQHLYQEMIAGKAIQSKLTITKMLAFLLAGLVHSITLTFVVLGLWFIVFNLPNWGGFILAIPCFVIAWLFLPNIPKPENDPLPRNSFPVLYGIADRIAQVLNSPPVDGIVPGIEYTASFGQYGLQRKRMLTLGLPLFAVLSGNEKVALLGHEIAHGVNGDPNRNFFIWAAIHSLVTWYQIIHPANRLHKSYGLVSIFIFFINIASLLVAGIIWWWAYLLVQLLWRNSQRAEYLADLLAAQVSGTEAHLSTLEKTYLYETFQLSLKLAYLNKDGANFFRKLQQRVAQVPSRELERIRRLEKLENFRIDTTHPPTIHRIEFLKAHYVPVGKVVLSEVELAQLNQELAPLYEQVQDELFSLDSMTFRSLFRLNW